MWSARNIEPVGSERVRRHPHYWLRVPISSDVPAPARQAALRPANLARELNVAPISLAYVISVGNRAQLAFSGYFGNCEPTATTRKSYVGCQ